MTENQELAEIERLENLRYAAMLSHDVEALDRLLHERLLHVHSTGNQHTKAAYLAGLAMGDWTYRQIDRSNQEIILQGTVALVFNHLFLRLELKGKNIELRNQALSVWIQEHGTWQLLAMHSGLESLRENYAKPQISPLRVASVEMTNLLNDRESKS